MTINPLLLIMSINCLSKQYWGRSRTQPQYFQVAHGRCYREGTPTFLNFLGRPRLNPSAGAARAGVYFFAGVLHHQPTHVKEAESISNLQRTTTYFWKMLFYNTSLKTHFLRTFYAAIAPALGLNLYLGLIGLNFQRAGLLVLMKKSLFLNFPHSNSVKQATWKAAQIQL